MTVKILGVRGSPRKASTDYVLNVALEEAAKVPGVETHFLALRTKRIHPCNQCDQCLKLDPGKTYEHYCVFHDDMDELMRLFLEMDGYIIASPVYDMNVTPELNIFFNRFRPLWRVFRGIHRNKVGGSISLGGTRHGGQETCVAMINNFFLINEILVTGGPSGCYTGATVWTRDQKEQGAMEDEVGMATVRGVGRRVAEVATILKYGKEALKAEGITF